MTTDQGAITWSHRAGRHLARSRTLTFMVDPVRGLVDVRHEPTGLLFPLLLGIEFLSAQDLGTKPLAEAGDDTELVIRGNVVLVQYKLTSARPVECHARWRIGPADTADLEVSALTPRPCSALTVRTRSILPAGEPVRGGDAVPFLYMHRLSNAPLTYVEMCHPNDAAGPVCEQTDSVSFQLFGHDLEKGVILRGRLRAMLVRRQGDRDAALSAYRTFLEEPPNLSL